MKTYRSKFGWSVFLFMIIVFAVTIIPIFYKKQIHTLYEIVIQCIVFVIILLFFVMISLGTKYIISEEKLIVKCSPFYNKKIAIAEITKIKKTNSPISSPAPSLDRIDIHYEKYNSVVISPKNKTEFITHLKSINPSIEVTL